MSHRWTLLSIASVPAIALGVALSGGPAAAAPANANTFLVDLSCSNGQQYTISLLDPAADPAVGHVVDGTAVLIPTAFQFDITVLDAAGNVLDQISSPVDAVRGGSGQRHDVMTCTFSDTETEQGPGGEVVTIRVDGTVQGYQIP